jgi:hypothetical protein
MKMQFRTLSSAFCLAALLSTAASAHATSFTLDSNHTSVSYAGSSGTASTPVSFGSLTFDIGTGGGVWAVPIGTSSWVSFNPGNAPGGSYVAPSGTYDYSDSFTAAAGDSGVVWVLADDTTSIYLNNILVEAPTNTSAAARCVDGTPNCENATEFTLPTADFVNGTNVLKFGVEQLY